MTISEHFTQRLIENGLWDEEAKVIIEICQTSQDYGLKPMLDKWSNDAKSFPEPVERVTWLSIKEVAKDWLMQNAPEHFALSIL